MFRFTVLSSIVLLMGIRAASVPPIIDAAIENLTQRNLANLQIYNTRVAPAYLNAVRDSPGSLIPFRLEELVKKFELGLPPITRLCENPIHSLFVSSISMAWCRERVVLIATKDSRVQFRFEDDTAIFSDVHRNKYTEQLIADLGALLTVMSNHDTFRAYRDIRNSVLFHCELYFEYITGSICLAADLKLVDVDSLTRIYHTAQWMFLEEWSNVRSHMNPHKHANEPFARPVAIKWSHGDEFTCQRSPKILALKIATRNRPFGVRTINRMSSRDFLSVAESDNPQASIQGCQRLDNKQPGEPDFQIPHVVICNASISSFNQNFIYYIFPVVEVLYRNLNKAMMNASEATKLILFDSLHQTVSSTINLVRILDDRYDKVEAGSICSLNEKRLQEFKHSLCKLARVCMQSKCLRMRTYGEQIISYLQSVLMAETMTILVGVSVCCVEDIKNGGPYSLLMNMLKRAAVTSLITVKDGNYRLLKSSLACLLCKLAKMFTTYDILHGVEEKHIAILTTAI